MKIPASILQSQQLLEVPAREVQTPARAIDAEASPQPIIFPFRPATLEERMDDLRAVMDAAGSQRAATVSRPRCWSVFPENSVGLGTRELNHFASFVGFVGEELAEIGGRARKQGGAKLFNGDTLLSTVDQQLAGGVATGTAAVRYVHQITWGARMSSPMRTAPCADTRLLPVWSDAHISFDIYERKTKIHRPICR